MAHNNTTVGIMSGGYADSRIAELYETGAVLHRYWILIIFIFGIPGSILSFIIMMNRKNRQLSICVYMAYLSITDNILLFIGGFAWLVLEGEFHLSVYFCV